MSATMLQLVQQATGEMGLSVPSSVAGNTTQDVVQQLALLNAVGYEVMRKHQWEALTVEYRFTTQYYQYTGTSTTSSTSLTSMSSIANLDSTYMISGSGINQDTYVSSAASTTVVMSQAATSSNTGATYTFGKTKYTLPSDYDRQIDQTHWDKSKHWSMLGPMTAQQWQFYKGSYISNTGPRVMYRILGGYFQIWPQQNTNEYLGFEYLSNNWALSASGTAKSSFTVDTDTCVFPDRLMVLGLKLKYFQIKGFDTTALQQDYNQELALAIAHDAGSPVLTMAPRPTTLLIGFGNIPDSGYGS